VARCQQFAHLDQTCCIIGIAEVAQAVLESDAEQEDVDSFLEEAIIRRELSFNLCFYRDDYDSLTALPDWAKRTLDAHRDDRRKRDPHDEVWNLAHRQLLETGTMHGYLRMLWGKKLIEWSSTPEKALAAMIGFHDRYAIDGRDPNTYAGVLWCFGKHDRPWAPERPIFGTIRYMSSAQTAKKSRSVWRRLIECKKAPVGSTPRPMKFMNFFMLLTCADSRIPPTLTASQSART